MLADVYRQEYPEEECCVFIVVLQLTEQRTASGVTLDLFHSGNRLLHLYNIC